MKAVCEISQTAFFVFAHSEKGTVPFSRFRKTRRYSASSSSASAAAAASAHA